MNMIDSPQMSIQVRGYPDWVGKSVYIYRHRMIVVSNSGGIGSTQKLVENSMKDCFA